MGKYIIAFDPPEKIEKRLKKEYKRLLGSEITISNLHLTILPPFKLTAINEQQLKDTVKNTQLPTLNVSFGTIGFFEYPDEINVYFEVKPSEKLNNYYESLVSALAGKIEFDFSLWEEKKLPEFLPHISLNYKFSGQKDKLIELENVFKDMGFELTGPHIYLQEQSGKWSEVKTI